MRRQLRAGNTNAVRLRALRDVAVIPPQYYDAATILFTLATDPGNAPVTGATDLVGVKAAGTHGADATFIVTIPATVALVVGNNYKGIVSVTTPDGVLVRTILYVVVS